MKTRPDFLCTMPWGRWSQIGLIFMIGVAVFLLGGRPQAAEKLLSGDRIPTAQGDLIIHPINHATFAMQWNGKLIYVDPIGGAQRYEALPRPDLIVLTDIHGDHLDVPTLSAITRESVPVMAPTAVTEKLPEAIRKQTTVLTNGQTQTVLGIKIEAIPMYNLTADRLKFHSKGRGNGYVFTLGGKRVYVSGDTEDIPEMRALKQIDVAFVCMNLPYTMTATQAANAVREFKPAIVYPYHYRGTNLEEFKKAVGEGNGTEVRLRDWYQ